MDNVRIEVDEVDDEYVKVILYTETVKTTYILKKANDDMSYHVESKEGQIIGDTDIIHYRGKYKNADDEIIFLSYRECNAYGNLPGNIRLKISLTTGLAWNEYEDKLPRLATQKQIKVMIEHLKRVINNIKKVIIDNIVDNTRC